jgi:hypothetical protein
VRGDSIDIDGRVVAGARPDGDGGRITLAGSHVEVGATGEVAADGFESGSGGVVSMRADQIRLSSVGDTAAEVSASGNEGGYVHLAGVDLEAQGAVLAIGFGRSGALRLHGEESLIFAGPGAVAIASGGARQGAADATSILLQSEGSVEISAGALVSASGLPRVVAIGQIDDNSARLLIRESSPGRVAVRAAELTLVERGRIESTSFAAQSGGDIDVRVGKLSIDGVSSELQAGTAGAGTGGSVSIAADTIDVRHGGRISTASESLDEARFEELVGRLFDVDGVSVEIETPVASGPAGSIEISANVLELDGDRSAIGAGASAGGDGGNVDLSIQTALVRRGGTIEADARLGQGGLVTVSGPLIADAPAEKFITARGPDPLLDGIVVVNDDASQDLTEGTVALPSNVLDASSQLEGRCAQGPAGSFVERLDRLPPAPDGPLVAWPEAGGEASLAGARAPAERTGAYLALGGGCR